MEYGSVRDLMLALDESINRVTKCAFCASVQCPPGRCIFRDIVVAYDEPAYSTSAVDQIVQVVKDFVKPYQRTYSLVKACLTKPVYHPRHSRR